MHENLNSTEVRILASLVEKQLTTPEYYPLTLNALLAACNQKSNRDPVMSLTDTEVLTAIDGLRDRNLVYLHYGSTSRTVKYKHMLPSIYELEPPATAVMAVLMLRGPQTLGEIRDRSGRLYEFGGIPEVAEQLDELARRDEPLVIKLERQPGQKDARYAHLLSGPVEAGITAQLTRRETPADNNKISELERKLAEMREEFTALRGEFAEFRKQFE